MVAHIGSAGVSRQETGAETRQVIDTLPKLSEHLRKSSVSNMADGLHLNGDTTSSSNGTVSEGYLPAECKFTVHAFSDTILDQQVHFQILKMTDSLYVWIGTSPEMDALAVAMCTKYVSSLLILGNIL